MSSGPFGDRTRADLSNKRLNDWLDEDGFTKTLVDLLKTLSSLPTHPARPDLYLEELLGITRCQTNNEMLAAIMNKARQQLVEELEENRRLSLRYDHLNELLSEDIRGDVDKVIQQLNKSSENHQ
ncbi:hypothetical protein COOONC_10105 [Cooperia oncophora]